MKLNIRWRKVIVTYLAGAAACLALYFAARAYFLTPATRAETHFASQLSVGNTLHNFGKVTPGAVLEHVFTIRNDGAKRVVLNRIEGCACGEDPKDRSIVLAAGAETQIPVKLEAGVKAGPVRHVLVVTTSDPRRPRIEFALTAHVIDSPALHGVPKEVDLTRN